MIRKKTTLVVIVSLFFLSGLGVCLYVYPRARSTYLLKNADVQRILSKVTMIYGGDITKIPASSSMFPYTNKNYHKEITKYERGDAERGCLKPSPYYSDLKSYTIENSYYPYRNYSKTATLDEDNNYLDYVLNYQGINTRYLGGEYAIRSMPWPGYVPDDSRNEEGSFEFGLGSNADKPLGFIAPNPEYTHNPSALLDSVKRVGNRYYYVVSFDISILCSDSYSVKAGKRVLWIETNDYSILRDEIYVDKVEGKNLMLRKYYTQIASNIDSKELNELFKFDLDVEVKDILITSASFMGSLVMQRLTELKGPRTI